MTSRLRNAVTLVAIGTMCWVIAGVIALAVNAEARIIWTCVMGLSEQTSSWQLNETTWTRSGKKGLVDAHAVLVDQYSKDR